MKTATPNEKTMHAGEEERSEKLAWQRPLLKVLPIDSARKSFSSTPDGAYTS
jgi:hypothetical protein